MFGIPCLVPITNVNIYIRICIKLRCLGNSISPKLLALTIKHSITFGKWKSGASYKNTYIEIHLILDVNILQNVSPTKTTKICRKRQLSRLAYTTFVKYWRRQNFEFYRSNLKCHDIKKRTVYVYKACYIHEFEIQICQSSSFLNIYILAKCNLCHMLLHNVCVKEIENV